MSELVQVPQGELNRLHSQLECAQKFLFDDCNAIKGHYYVSKALAAVVDMIKVAESQKRGNG